MRAIEDVGVHGFAKQCSLHFVRSALNRSPMNTNALPLQGGCVVRGGHAPDKTMLTARIMACFYRVTACWAQRQASMHI